MSLQLSTTRLFARQPNEHLKSLFKPSKNTSLPCLASSSQHVYPSVMLLANPHASISIRLDQLEKYLSLSSAISKHVILSRLVQDVVGLNSLMREKSSTALAINDVVDLDDYKMSESELRELLGRAKQVDEALVEKYLTQVESTLEKCIKLRQGFHKVISTQFFENEKLSKDQIKKL